MKTVNLLGVLLGMISLTACSGGGGGGTTTPPPPGVMEVTVVDLNTTQPVPNARVIVIDGDTGNPVDVLVTDAKGIVKNQYPVGSLQLKISADGYAPSPAPAIPPLPVEIVSKQTTAITISLSPLAYAERGSLTGKVVDDAGKAVVGALLVITSVDGSQSTTLTDLSGNYLMYNLPIGDVTVETFMGGLNFTPVTALSINLGSTTTKNISASSKASGKISGHVSFTATSGDIIDITLLHPGTREVLPGLRTFTTSGGNYSMAYVPNGTFEIIASLENDGYVLDPDTSVTQGIPRVTVNNDSITRDFKVTGSIVLTNPDSAFKGIPLLSDLPNFTWVKDSSYASADDYVVEVVDESGNSVWGGFDRLNNFAAKVTSPQSNSPAIGYNEDGTATLPMLEPGRYYQLRVYARVLDNTSTGYTLLSASETLDGIFKVQ